jgi:lysophospholipase L1-like esterase
MNKSRIIFATLIGLACLTTSPAAFGGGIAIKDGEKLAFLGDSITANGYNQPIGYVNLVINALTANGVHVTPIPAGVSGNTSKNMIGRIDRDVIGKKPDWVTISCGVNDVWHHATGVELEQYKVNMTSLIDKCQTAGIKVMLLTSTMIGEDQANPENQQLIAYNDFLRALAKEKHCLLADLNAQMQSAVKVSEGSATDHGSKNRLTIDGVHMNPVGNMMMAAGILGAFGLTDAQIGAAKEKWQDIPKAVDISKVSVSLRQQKTLEAVAAKRHQTVNELVGGAIATTVDELLKGDR